MKFQRRVADHFRGARYLVAFHVCGGEAVLLQQFGTFLQKEMAVVAAAAVLVVWQWQWECAVVAVVVVVVVFSNSSRSSRQ